MATKKNTASKQKYVIKTKFDTYATKKGTTQKTESKTDQSQQADAEIYKVIEKYGIQSLLNQKTAKEPMYLDLTLTRGLTIPEAVRQKEQMEAYFEQMPARARKMFGDNVEEFVAKYRNGELDTFIETGALTEEMANEIKKEEKAIFDAEVNKAVQIELAKIEALKEKETTDVQN